MRMNLSALTLSLGLAFSLAPSAVLAQQTVSIQIPSQPLGDALLKLGMLAQLDGKKAEAKTFYEQVIKGYPNTSPAQLAKQSLSKL